MKNNKHFKLILILAIILGYVNKVISQDKDSTKPKPIEFSLYEAKTNKPIINTIVEVNYYDIAFHTPRLLELIKKVKTDSVGKFTLPISIFQHGYPFRDYGVTFNDKYEIITFQADSNCLINIQRKKNRGNPIGVTSYDLNSDIESNYIPSGNYVFIKDSFEQKMGSVKLIAYDKGSDFKDFIDLIKKKQFKFEYKQRKLWALMWKNLQLSYNDEKETIYHEDYWSSLIRSCSQLFELNLQTVFSETKKIDDKNKKYYFLYAVCLIACYNIVEGKSIDKKIMQWIDIEVKKFYNERVDLKFDSFINPEDNLGSLYLSMKKGIKE